ncbi:predicted protein [Uncinocarpus reesii 1704]|uniref:Uncharacterized protein n=1 Tax=Uncinocarpus reesii (strain UAMH 1704) TaxID=336963 RepID=C4JS43_UNCRE|nr:uncharacterized protein UREG_05282 [Uncinocarpus reesii 1704]EEP80440.1 predicted protein [Uncinocarpus reesii 1704]
MVVEEENLVDFEKIESFLFGVAPSSILPDSINGDNNDERAGHGFKIVESMVDVYQNLRRWLICQPDAHARYAVRAPITAMTHHENIDSAVELRSNSASAWGPGAVLLKMDTHG